MSVKNGKTPTARTVEVSIYQPPIQLGGLSNANYRG